MSITMLISTSALIVASAMIFAFQYFQLNDEKLVQISILADAIATNSSAAIAFNDPKAATEVLSALRAEPDVLGAVIITQRDQVFASYQPEKSLPFSNWALNHPTETAGQSNGFLVSKPVILDGDQLGTLYVWSGLGKLHNSLVKFLSVIFITCALALILTFILISFLQRKISAPIMHLAETARKISCSRDYTLRAKVSSDDEIGALSNDFNLMLAEIGRRDRALIDAHDSLELRVQERTRELEDEINSRCEVEAALRREQAQLRAIIKNAPVAVAMFDNDMQYLVVSDCWLEEYQLHANIIGKSYYAVFGNLDQRWKDIHRAALSGKVMTASEDTFKCNDGSVMPLRWALHPWWRVDGSQGGVIMVTTRIDQLVNARESALKAAQLKAEFIANISHELRTPLNGVIGFSELLSETELNDQQKDWLDSLEHSARLLLVLINDVLDFEKMASGKLVLEEVPFTISEVITNTIRIFRPQADKRNLKLRATLPENLPSLIQGDPYRLQQILLNLLSNAIKFTDSGEVELKVEVSELQDSKYEVTFMVRDTGIGVPANKLDLIFQAFAQADGSITRKFGGTGLGLAISSRLVELMAGKLMVESTQGIGSTFYFKLVFSALVPHEVERSQSSASSITQQKTSDAPGAIRRILVAEDNSVNRRLVEALLGKNGYECILAVNGVKAVELAMKEKFDLILMDLQMPEMGGIEAFNEIRKVGKGHNTTTPVIALTAHAFGEDRKRCMEAGMDDFVSKPHDTAHLLRTIKKWTGQDIQEA